MPSICDRSMPLRKSREHNAMEGIISVCFGRRTTRRSKGRGRVAAAVARWARRHCVSLQQRRQRAPASSATEQQDAHGDDDDRDYWSGLPEDLLLTAMASMEVTDVVHAWAVCSSWRSAYAQFRRLRLPAKPNPPPWLLHANAADGAAAIYSPSTGATFPCGDGGGEYFVAGGSTHGWVFAADVATANPCLLNPLTGARAALPPVATLARVKGSFFDDDGIAVYDVDHAPGGATPDMQLVTARRVRSRMFRHVAISAAGVVLLVHMPHGEASYARPGDERWTSLSSHLEPDALYAVHNDDDGLFYLLCQANGGIFFAVAVTGPAAPTAWPVSYMFRIFNRRHSHYLVFRGGELLLVTRHLLLTRPRKGEKEISTADICIEKVGVDRSKFVRLAGVGEDYALFLGYGSPVCLPVKDYPMLQCNCAYLADDSEQHFPPITRRDVGIWDFGSRSMRKFDDLHPWLDNQPPIWIIPSLY